MSYFKISLLEAGVIWFSENGNLTQHFFLTYLQKTKKSPPQRGGARRAGEENHHFIVRVKKYYLL